MPYRSASSDLRDPRLGQSKVVEPEVRRQHRLQMTAEPGASTCDGVPLGEAWAPRLIVDGHRMELREQERRETRHVDGRAGRGRRQRPSLPMTARIVRTTMRRSNSEALPAEVVEVVLELLERIALVAGVAVLDLGPTR